MRRSAAPSRLHTGDLTLPHTSSALKRKAKDSGNEDDYENEASSRSRSKSSGPGELSLVNSEWAKFRENLRMAKNKTHDNYDSASFRSQFRKPLASMQLSTAPIAHSKASTIESGSSKSHVKL